jgi:hypothetical protein
VTEHPVEDRELWPDNPVDTPPSCPRCGGVHVDVHQVAWDDRNADADDERSREESWT